MFISVDARRRAAEEDPRWATKSILRLVGTLFAFLSLVLFSASISHTNKNFTNTAGPGDWTDGLALAPALLSLLYNPIDLALHLLVRKGRPAHPAVHAGADLIVWALLAPAIIVGAAGGIFWYWTAGVPNEAGVIDCSFFFNTFTKECSPIAYTIGQMEIVGLVFLFFLFIIHLTMFVFAIMDLHRRRVARTLGTSFNMQHKDAEHHGSFSGQSASPSP